MERSIGKVTDFSNKNKRLLGGATSTRRAFTLASGKVVYGEHTVTPYNEIASSIAVHALNPRIQEDLSFDACGDIATKIEHEGVLENGITVVNRATGKADVIEGSRRLWCANEYHKDFPHWKIDDEVSDSDIEALIRSLESKKPISYRERGMKYPKIMADNNLTKVDELAAFLGRKKETTRKLLQAATIDPVLIHAFPDCNGIPNTYYAKLAKVERDINKFGGNVVEFVKAALSQVTTDQNTPLLNRQAAVMESLEALRIERFESDKPKPESRTIVEFSDKKKSAVVEFSADKRTATFVLKRLDASLISQIEQLIKAHSDAED